MKRHQGRLADTKGKQRDQNGQHRRVGRGRQNATELEVRRAGNRPGPGNGRQQQHHRRADQQQQIDAAAANGLLVGLVCHQRIGRQRQDFVTDKQREQVLGERKSHGAGNRNRKADVEQCLPVLFVAAHIAD